MWLLVIVNLAGKAAAILVGRTAPVTALALWFGTDGLLAYHLFVPGAQGLVRMHRRFATTQREVWLTIDDGPHPESTPRMLMKGSRGRFLPALGPLPKPRKQMQKRRFPSGVMATR